MFDDRDERAYTACFTGHRPPKCHSSDPALRAAVGEAIDRAIADGFTVFMGGMALGADTVFAEEVLARRHAGASIRFVAAVPCETQDARWSPTEQRHYRRLLAEADTVAVMCPQYEPYCMNARNRYMVENSRRLIAAWDGSNGGTANTVRLAENYSLEIIRLHW